MQEKNGAGLFRYVQCEIEVSEHLKNYFSNFPAIFKNIVVNRTGIGNLMRECAQKEGRIVQRGRTLISSFHLINRILITLLLSFHLELALICEKIHRLVQYTPIRCFSSFVQSALTARRQGEVNPYSSVVAETMKLLAKIY